MVTVYVLLVSIAYNVQWNGWLANDAIRAVLHIVPLSAIFDHFVSDMLQVARVTKP